MLPLYRYKQVWGNIFKLSLTQVEIVNEQRKVQTISLINSLPLPPCKSHRDILNTESDDHLSLKRSFTPLLLGLSFTQARLDFPLTQEHCKETNSLRGRKLSANADARACLHSTLKNSQAAETRRRETTHTNAECSERFGFIRYSIPPRGLVFLGFVKVSWIVFCQSILIW